MKSSSSRETHALRIRRLVSRLVAFLTAFRINLRERTLIWRSINQLGQKRPSGDILFLSRIQEGRSLCVDLRFGTLPAMQMQMHLQCEVIPAYLPRTAHRGYLDLGTFSIDRQILPIFKHSQSSIATLVQGNLEDPKSLRELSAS